MPSNKNQHFVPRCHLRPFSLDTKGAAINVYNRDRDRGVRNAPVKGQCSKDYFYGRDLTIEKFLQQLEGQYASTLAKVGQQLNDPSKFDLDRLRDFAYLQMSRTENTIKRRREAIEGMDELAYRGKEQYREYSPTFPHDMLVVSSLKLYLDSLKNLSDLDVVLLRNNTHRDFITSDDPAVLTNRLHLQRLGGLPFGLISVGTQLTMPLTPRLAMVCYDREAYAAPNRNGPWIDITRVADVLAVNELQHLSCASNLFFSNWDEVESIEREHDESSSRRPGQWARWWVGVLEWEDSNGEFYRRATEEEIEGKATKVMSTSPVYPHPAKWLSELPMRPKVYGYTNGSAAGFVRHEQVRMLQPQRQMVRQELKYRGTYDPLGPKTAYLMKDG
jgi:hypothetical protein